MPLSLAKKLVFSDPYASDILQHERLSEISPPQNFRVIAAREKCTKEKAFEKAAEETFKNTVIYGLGTTGLFIGDQIRRNHPDAKLLFVARSSENSDKVKFAKEVVKADYISVANLTQQEIADRIKAYFGSTASVFIGTSGDGIESRIAFEYGVLGCNGIYDSFSLGRKVSFDSMAFGLKNQVIFASINFTRKHMEQAIEILSKSRFDELVELIDREEFTQNPIDAYLNKIYSKGAPLKTAVIWNRDYIDGDK
jgi:threonine dehydrogenase-like Zn-dependent dehydrogenase